MKLVTFLYCALGVASSAAAEPLFPPPADPSAPKFEIERDWSGQLRPRYKAPQAEEPLSSPVITPEQPRTARRAEPAPKIEVWEEDPRQSDRTRESRSASRDRGDIVIEDRDFRSYDRDDRSYEGTRNREWERRERRRAERAWREQEKAEREFARRERRAREPFEEEYFDDTYDDEDYWQDRRRYRR
ncbi:MAG: hypothetical protein AB7E79_04785 [Rhodospirillaceae bacterium]